MAGEIVAPAVRQLDNGYQAPSPVDWVRAGAAVAQPYQQAVTAGMDTRQNVAMAQFNANKAMELAKWNHSAQIQRETLRDQRMVQVAQMRANAQLQALKEKGALDDIKSKGNYLVNKLGGDPVSRFENESDADYSTRLDNAIKTKLQANIAADSKAAYSIKKQIASYNQYLNDPRVQSAVGGEVQAARNDPGVKAQAQNFVNTNLSAWLDKVAGDHSDLIQQAISQSPGQTQDILQRAGLGDAYNQFVVAATQQAANNYLKVAGSPAARNFAAASEDFKMLNQRYQSLGMMAGDNGRMVRKPWWSDVENSVDDMTLHEQQIAQAQLKQGVAAGAIPAPAAAPAPVAAKPAFNLGGSVTGGTPVVQQSPPVAGNNIIPMLQSGLTTPSGAGTVRLENGTLNYYPIAAGALPPNAPNILRMLPNPAGAAIAGIAPPPVGASPQISPQDQAWVNMLKTYASGGHPFAPAAGVMPAASNANVASAPASAVMPPMPVMTAAPAGATISPLAGVVAPATTSSLDPSSVTAPWDAAMQTMQMRNMYSQ